MFKTLFSRMLVTYLAVTLGLLLMLGITVSGLFQNQYISEKQGELRREAGEINAIIVNRYLDDDKRPVARDELFTIARKYDAMLHIYFSDPKFGRVVFIDEESVDKWAGSEELDLSSIADNIINTGTNDIRRDMLSSLIDIPVMSYMGPISDADGNIIAALFLHIDMSSVNDSITKVYLDVLLSGLVAVILAFMAVSYITGRMTKPITEMNQTVLRYSKGELDLRVEAAGEDEVGQLGKSFNIMADELGTLEQSRRSFVANVSHELRSPLTSMRGFLTAMQDGVIPEEEYPKYLDIVIGENNRMTAMVNDLLDLARIESGQYVLKIETFDINELILRTLLTFEARINAKSLEVTHDFGDDRAYVEADQSQIVQVLRNLIDNAIKFSNDGGTLLVCAHSEKKLVRVTVADSGKGIAQADIPYVFDRFYKAEKAHTPSDSSGTGLGLSIVKRIIDQHGSTISVESAAGEGTRFTFTLKQAKSARIQDEKVPKK